MQKDIGIIMNGATGRICSTQHLANSLVPIMKSGGLQFQNTELVPRVVLLGRDDQKLRRISKEYHQLSVMQFCILVAVC